MAELAVHLGPLRLAHPLINASGTMEIEDIAASVDERVLSDPPVAAYVVKTVTLSPRPGNPPPRIVETVGGMMNAVGLPSEGLEGFVAKDLSRLLALPCPSVVSIGGFSTSEYVGLAVGLRVALEAQTQGGWVERVGLELNISCPNVHSGCVSIGSDPKETEQVVRAVRKVWPGLLLAKLTPNVTDMVAVARAAEGAGADAVAAVNTYKGLALDRTTLRPYLGNVTGGLSGPAIKPLALRAVHELFEGVAIPIVGMGGVATVQDVLDFMACGARVVAVGSAGLLDHRLAARLAVELERALQLRGWALEDLLGIAHR